MQLWNEITRIRNLTGELKVNKGIRDGKYPPYTSIHPLRNPMQKDGFIRKFDMDWLEKAIDDLQTVVSKDSYCWLPTDNSEE